MRLISYAQNCEDIMIWRALRHVEHGFYIDVGANEPTADSVTKLLYDRGWRGVNIEPLPNYAQALRAERPRDINLQCAAGPKAGQLQLWNCEVRGWASADPKVVAAHQSNGFLGEYLTVPMMTLTQVCQAHCPADIHFLKVDVEGYELEVLQGMDFARFRPWIVVVEAHRPDSYQQGFTPWDPLLTDRGYSFVFGDGLNRFYLSNEHSELAPKLQYPPNVLDDFVRIGIVHGETLVQEANQLAQHLQSSALEHEQRAEQWQSRALEHEQRAEQWQSGALKWEASAKQWQSSALEYQRCAAAEQRNGKHLNSMLELSRADLHTAQSNLETTQIQAESTRDQLRLTQAQLNAALKLTEVKVTELIELKRQLTQCDEYLQAMMQSRSWRLTRPLRIVSSFFRRGSGREKLPGSASEFLMPADNRPEDHSGRRLPIEQGCLPKEPLFPAYVDERTRKVFLRLQSAVSGQARGDN